MAEILALGLTHYPPLWGPDERMSWIFRRMLTNPKLPETLKQPDGWPEPARAQWGNDQGTAEAGRHREALVGWFSKTRAALDAFKPDFVLMWGDDQYENFKEDVVPPYCLFAYERFKFATPPGNVWGETDKTWDLAGPSGGGEDAGVAADRGRLRHGLFLQAAAPSARPRLHQRGDVSRLRAQGLRLSVRAVRHQLLRPQGAGAARRVAGVRPRDQRGGLGSAGAVAEAAVRSRRCDGAHPRRLALSRGADRLVGLEPRLPDGEEQLPVARHRGRPAHVRGAEARRLGGVARDVGGCGRGQRPAGDPELVVPRRRDERARAAAEGNRSSSTPGSSIRPRRS